MKPVTKHVILLAADVVLVVWIWRNRFALSSIQEESRGFPIEPA